MYVSAFEEFQNALYIYIDLGSQGALTADLQDFVLSEIETQLRTKHGVDVHERNLFKVFITARFSDFNAEFTAHCERRISHFTNKNLFNSWTKRFVAEIAT